MVSISWPTPRCDRVSHCSGTSTAFAAVSALMVMMPSDGEQSSRIQS